MNKHERLIEFAIQVAHKSRINQKQRVGCVITNKSIPINFGFNDMRKTHPRALRYDFPYIHAELHAMIGVDNDKLSGSTAYVARVKKNNKSGMAKPCEFCQEELRQQGVKDVYFTTETNEIGYIKLWKKH